MKLKIDITIENQIIPIIVTIPKNIEVTTKEEAFYIFLEEFEDAYEYDSITDFQAFIKRWKLSKSRTSFILYTEDNNDEWSPHLYYKNTQGMVNKIPIGRDTLEDYTTNLTIL